MEAGNLIPDSISRDLPSMVRNEVARLSAQKQGEFVEEYRRKAKTPGWAYVLWLLLGAHYAFLGKWGLQVIFWLTLGGFCVWWVIDAFRITGMVKDYNKDAAVDVLRNLKAVGS